MSQLKKDIYNIAAVTTTRADYGLLRPVLRRLEKQTDVKLSLAVSGSHLVRALGRTLDEVTADGFKPDALIDIFPGGEDTDTGEAAALALSGFSEYFKTTRPDAVLLLGDRFEMLSAAFAASVSGVPVVHISGGDVTRGAKDDCYRHCITKLSSLHFPSTAEYRKRVIQLGEAPDTVILAGSLGAENAKNVPPLSADELSGQLGFDCSRPFLLATLHPETLSDQKPEAQINELLSALEALGMPVLFTGANADEGGDIINKRLGEWCKTPDRVLVMSLGLRRYLSALRLCAAVVGNSSSAVIEAAALHRPAVNIGERQAGRIMADSMLCCACERGDILAALKKAVSAAFSRFADSAPCPYGEGNASEVITSQLLRFLREDRLLSKKSFYDVDFTL